ncbi:hypothetical protein BDC45DRAFT_539946 [Circinella umbellata]|nr:hypothetical protein BDC45DRAFT_539946 [Circinella umbellata]
MTINVCRSMHNYSFLGTLTNFHFFNETLHGPALFRAHNYENRVCIKSKRLQFALYHFILKKQFAFVKLTVTALLRALTKQRGSSKQRGHPIQCGDFLTEHRGHPIQCGDFLTEHRGHPIQCGDINETLRPSDSTRRPVTKHCGHLIQRGDYWVQLGVQLPDQQWDVRYF